MDYLFGRKRELGEDDNLKRNITMLFINHKIRIMGVNYGTFSLKKCVVDFENRVISETEKECYKRNMKELYDQNINLL